MIKRLVRVEHGSHLYGTSTPESDHDYKGVHLPSGTAILMGNPENVVDTSSVVKNEAGKNQAESVDDQSYSVQKFFTMLSKGDTVATEILFSAVPAYRCHTSTGLEFHSLWPQVYAVGKGLLNRQCKGFVGYCIRQAAKYGIKGSRMGTVRSVLDEIEKLNAGQWTWTRLREIESGLRTWSEDREHVSWENIPNPDGSDNWHLDVCDRKVSMNIKIGDAYDIFDRVWLNYGERARAAMTNEGIDWKAMSHAVRVARQAIELLDTGKITFPRPDAVQLLAIKRGKLPYDDVSKLLEDLVAEVHAASERSALPQDSDMTEANALILKLHKEQVNG